MSRKLAEEMTQGEIDEQELGIPEAELAYSPTSELETFTDAMDKHEATTIGFRVKLDKGSYETLTAMEKSSGIDRNTIMDMALQALIDADTENLPLYFQIASARKPVNFSGLKG